MSATASDRPAGHLHRPRFGRGRAALPVARISVASGDDQGPHCPAQPQRLPLHPTDEAPRQFEARRSDPDGADARMFDARSDVANEQVFAERCRADRHHFRFIVSPEDAAQLQSLRTFTLELMADAERGLGTTPARASIRGRKSPCRKRRPKPPFFFRALYWRYPIRT